MATVLTEKRVLFSGIWKPSPRASPDALLRQISTQFLTKKSLNATYQFCTDGLRLLVVHDNGRQGPRSEKIPLSGIQDICANRYSPVCLMTIYLDAERRPNYLVCRCESENDASHIVQTFREYKKSLIGEGYRIDLVKPQGKNWTLMPKQDNAVNGHSEMSSDSGDYPDGGTRRVEAVSNGIQSSGTGTEQHVKVDIATETFEREPCNIEGKSGFSVGVQTSFGDADSDRESMMSTTSFRSLKEELLSLSQEIRDIKFLLEKSGISAAQYFKRDVNDNTVEKHTLVPIEVNGHDLPSPTDSTNSADKRVNFVEEAVGLPEHDLRSISVQTVKGQRQGYYIKRQGRSEGRSSHAVRSAVRHRSSSSNSVPRSPASIGRAGGSEVFELPPRGVYIRGTDPNARLGYSSTIERPIEQVYNVYSRNFRSPRSKILVMPGAHGTMPAMRRPQSNSRSSVNDYEDSH